MMDNLDGFQKLVSTRKTFSISISISIGLDCRDPQPYKFKNWTIFAKFVCKSSSYNDCKKINTFQLS